MPVTKDRAAALRHINQCRPRLRADGGANAHADQRASGGGRGIRTPGTVSGAVVFKTTAIDHSAIPPRRESRQNSRLFSKVCPGSARVSLEV
jgi:hypothetical protein